ncbi:uncharacterized protein LOC113333641 [Papaver somniferum]|uniref:uncharacterized protein LOC113333641 n=1 Tax=Papaver somniferum TaxID=3469 RepID=UPI000E700E7A|nr:uncharacterized protein LOC113333641 [Papaver somniferum]
MEDDSGTLITNNNEIASNLINYFSSKFKQQSVEISDTILSATPQVINDDDNALLESIPSREEIRNAVFELNQDGSSGPDGFTGIFYRFAWDIIQEDLVEAIKYCWQYQVIPPGVNSNFLVLLPKVKGAKRDDQFKPIGLSNVFFKIFTKIIIVRMSDMLHKLVSPQQYNIFIFCNGGKTSIQHLKHLLFEYQQASGQTVSADKRKFFVGGTSIIRGNQLANLMNMKLLSFPEKYLGVMLVQGRVKTEHLWSFVEMLQRKLAAWICKLLTFQARLTLIRFVLSSIPLYNMSIYKWPKKAIKACERIIRNFLWSGNAEDKKCVTISWDQVCYHVEEGGIGIRKFEDINKALLMKLLWRILNSNEEWARFFLAKYKDKHDCWISYYKQSSVWPGIKWILQDFHEHTRWIVGNGDQIYVWRDNWILEQSIIKLFLDNDYIKQNIHMKVSNLIVNNKWMIPEEMLQFFTTSDFPTIVPGKDKIIWTAAQNGKFSVASAISFIRTDFPKLKWYKLIWKKCIHPSTCSNIWKITRGDCATDENLNKRGFHLVSRCYICNEYQDSMNHLLWECNYGQILWNCLGGIFAFKNPKSFEDILACSKQKSTVVQEIWFIVAFNVMVYIWLTRNIVFFVSVAQNVVNAKRRILIMVKDCEVRLKGYTNNSNYDTSIMLFFEIKYKKMKTPKIIECFFHLPEENYILLCCDGASRGNPGISGYGFVIRDCYGHFIAAESGGPGITTNFLDEVMGTLCALEWAVQHNQLQVIVNADSKDSIEVFSNNNLPWFALSR